MAQNLNWQPEHLESVFDTVGLVLFTLLQLKDIHCLFRTSMGFNVFLYKLLRGIAHSTKNTIGSQGSGFDGSLTTYVRWMFPDVPPLFLHFSCCLHAGINAGNIFDIAKIVYYKPIRDIKISIGDGSSSSEFFEILWGFNDNTRQKELRSRNTDYRKFQLMMDSRYDGYYYIDKIGCLFPRLIQLDLADENNFTSTQNVKRQCLVETFAHFDKLRTLNITGNFKLRVKRSYVLPKRLELFTNCLTVFSVQHNNNINDKFFDILATFAINLKDVYIFDCEKVSVQCLTFLARCKSISNVRVPRRMNDDVNIGEIMYLFRKKCRISFI